MHNQLRFNHFQNEEDIHPSTNILKNQPFITKMSFIRKVYLILLAQYSISLTSILILSKSRYFNTLCYSSTGQTILLLTILINLLIIASLGFLQQMIRKSPFNLILIVIFTISQTTLLSLIAIRWNLKSMIIGVSLFSTLNIALIIYTMVARLQFNISTGLFYTMICCVLVSLSLYFWMDQHYSQYLNWNILILIAAVYLLFDSQMIMNGGRFRLEYNDYIIAVFNIYIDTINILVYIVQFLGNE